MAWKGEAEECSYGTSHKAICPLLKQWRQVAKGGRGRRKCRLDASAAVIVLLHKHSLLRLLPDTLPGRGGDARGVLQGGETE